MQIGSDYSLKYPNEIYQVAVVKGDQLDYNKTIEAIERINKIVNWSHDDSEISVILKNSPTYCYFAKDKEQILGYAIIREECTEKHFHISWIATDTINRGIGSQLMHSIINDSKIQGHHKLTFTHRKESSHLKSFYEKVAKKEQVTYICEEKDDPLRYYITYKMEASGK